MTFYELKSDRVDPIHERIGEGMFTDREREMALLMGWADEVSERFASSMVLLSPRRFGKTSILERFYNRLFWEREDVIPFYYEFKKNKMQYARFVREYYLSILYQFLAYRVRDASIAFHSELTVAQLTQIAQDTGEIFAHRVLVNMPEWDVDELLQRALTLPQRLAIETGLTCIVMFDEFQRLDQLLYFDAALTEQYPPLSGAFSSVVESSVAPMLLAGSQVTFLTLRSLGGGMTGRVSPFYIKRMPMDGAIELAMKFARKKKIELPIELAHVIYQLTKGNPFYIWAIFNTRHFDRDWRTEEGIREILKFEIEGPGWINLFWREQFLDNMEAIDVENAKQMILYLMRNVGREVRVDEIVENLNLSISTEEANRRLRDLVWGDLIEQIGGGIYGGLTDPMLARVLRAEYSWELEQKLRSEVAAQIQQELLEEALIAKDELIASLRGQLNSWVGRIAEVFIRTLMKRFFDGQLVDGPTYFHCDGDVKLTAFSRVYTTFAQPPGAISSYQIDIYAEPKEKDDLPWVVEVKNWTRPVGKAEVEHFIEAAENLAADRNYSQVIRWFYARNGFSQPAETLLKEKGILYTKQSELVALLQDLKIADKWYEKAEEEG